jgi:hypothetical protein
LPQWIVVTSIMRESVILHKARVFSVHFFWFSSYLIYIFHACRLAAHMMFCIKGLAGSGACLSEKFRICCSATISSRYVYNLTILNYYIILACLLLYVVYLIQTFWIRFLLSSIIIHFNFSFH